jgi:glyoxylase-like metal-dependent hydrolase (beta-lactamase superfamily II)
VLSFTCYDQFLCLAFVQLTYRCGRRGVNGEYSTEVERMSLPNTFSYHFYPVGQGLFSAGSIRRQDEDSSRFLWVYDCGTSSSQDLEDAGILDLKRFANGRSRVDLLVLSHFDHDHISGVVRLLKEFEVGTLLLPYMPLAQRLVMAFEEGSGGGNDPLTGFYLNPDSRNSPIIFTRIGFGESASFK